MIPVSMCRGASKSAATIVFVVSDMSAFFLVAALLQRVSNHLLPPPAGLSRSLPSAHPWSLPARTTNETLFTGYTPDHSHIIVSE